MVLLLSKNEADYLARQHRRTSGATNCRGTPATDYRASGLVCAREGVLFAGWKSLPESATAP
jgi:hypothetical protein